MLKHDPQYIRLGRGKSFTGVTSYWLGPDHLLVVRIESFNERYQRFAYRDIQALLTRPTLRYLVINTVCLIILVPCVLALIFGQTEVRLTTLSAIIPLGIALAVNLWQGPSCICYLQTAVQTDKLPGLNRVRATRRALDRLKIQIDQAQAVEPNPVL